MVDKREENGVGCPNKQTNSAAFLKPNKSNEFWRLADNPSANNSSKPLHSVDFLAALVAGLTIPTFHEVRIG